jgi:hypothetical protein
VCLTKMHDKHLACRAFSPARASKYFLHLPHSEQTKQLYFFKKKLWHTFYLDTRQAHEFAVRFLSCAWQNIFFLHWSIFP